MRKLARVLALALALAATPACATTAPFTPVTESRQTLEQRAYLLVGAYALALESATPLLRDPATPRAVRAALGKAEAAATPAVELVKIAAVTQARRRDATTAAALAQAIAEAEAPVAALARLTQKGN